MVEEAKRRRAIWRRRARRTRGAWGLAVAGVVAAVVAGLVWDRVSGSGTLGRLAPALASRPGGTEARLYFPDPRLSTLLLETRRLPLRDDEVAWLRAVVEALADGPREGGAPALPRGTRVRGAYLGADGLAVVDLEPTAEPLDLGGAAGEFGAVYALVHTVADNVPGVRAVQILVGGEARETLAGHVKISEALAPRAAPAARAEP